jgi:hypothetical protein
MKLTEYAKTLEPYKRLDLTLKLAEACEVTKGAVIHWLNGTRKPSSIRWLVIEYVTRRKVRVSDFLKDI